MEQIGRAIKWELLPEEVKEWVLLPIVIFCAYVLVTRQFSFGEKKGSERT